MSYRRASGEVKLNFKALNIRANNPVNSINLCSNRKKFAVGINFYASDIAGLKENVHQIEEKRDFTVFENRISIKKSINLIKNFYFKSSHL
jgi:hypothetical protein